MMTKIEDSESVVPLPILRFEVAEAARILRISRAQLYKRIQEGLIRPQKDGARTYLTRAELRRYVESCDALTPPDATRANHWRARGHAKATPRP